MRSANVQVMKAATILWIGAGLLTGFNIFAASLGDATLVTWALSLTGGFAVFGVAFGIWAARKVTAAARR